MCLTGFVGVSVQVAAVHVPELRHVDGAHPTSLLNSQSQLLADTDHLQNKPSNF